LRRRGRLGSQNTEQHSRSPFGALLDPDQDFFFNAFDTHRDATSESVGTASPLVLQKSVLPTIEEPTALGALVDLDTDLSSEADVFCVSVETGQAIHRDTTVEHASRRGLLRSDSSRKRTTHGTKQLFSATNAVQTRKSRRKHSKSDHALNGREPRSTTSQTSPEHDAEVGRCAKHSIDYSTLAWSSDQLSKRIRPSEDHHHIRIWNFVEFIGNSECLIALMSLIREGKTNRQKNEDVMRGTSAADVYRRLVQRDGKIRLHGWQQWQDLVQLYEQSRHIARPQQGRVFEVVGVKEWNAGKNSSRRLGNPRQCQTALVTDQMMQYIIPDYKPSENKI